MKKALFIITCFLLSAVVLFVALALMLQWHEQPVKRETYILPRDFVGWVVILSAGNAEQPENIEIKVPKTGIVKVQYIPHPGRITLKYVEENGKVIPIYDFSETMKVVKAIHTESSGSTSGEDGRSYDYYAFFVGTDKQLQNAPDKPQFIGSILKKWDSL